VFIVGGNQDRVAVPNEIAFTAIENRGSDVDVLPSLTAIVTPE
jgi:hypothetical protein